MMFLHVMPALIRKFHEAKMQNKLLDGLIIFLKMPNVGTGKEITIKELAEMIKEVVGYKGELKFNTEKPDGTPRKLLDVSKLAAAGWKYKIELKAGIEKSYQWFKENWI